ncbi:carbohydrate ABC transporter permease [Aggregatilinea lenta]|uniref:carbohydrate ABC transporter permease n=1 Tax=Aggregatilinea lenta TaxID=913108 RepID=UPI000E5AF813|nr:carbohydrate ABC transporter permease [Aggregatilinea lenta]
MDTLRTQSSTTPSRTFHVNVGRLVSKLLVYVLFLVLAVIALYPMVWIITNSLKTDIDLFESTWALPKEPLWDNYQRAWDYGIARYILNSVLVTSVTTVVTVALSTMAAYALARFDFPGRTFWFLFILGGLMLAPQVALIPLFRTLVKLGIYNTYLAMILPYVAFGIPFNTFLLRSYLLGLPREIEEAGLIDGAGPVRVFWHIVIPLSRPMIASAMVLQAMTAWNEFMFALTFIESDDLRTLPIGIMSFMSTLRSEFTVVMAGLVIAALPMILVFLVAQRQFIRGLTAGGLKG